jgi:hypothetical protein
MNANDLLARVFGALETFITHFHASLILIVRVVSTVTLDTSGVTRQFAFHFNMTLNSRHKTPLKRGGTRNSMCLADQPAERKELKVLPKRNSGCFRALFRSTARQIQQDQPVGGLSAPFFNLV